MEGWLDGMTLVLGWGEGSLSERKGQETEIHVAVTLVGASVIH